jgi:hypothetical protein
MFVCDCPILTIYCSVNTAGMNKLKIVKDCFIRMEEMPSLNVPVQRLKVATLPLDLPCSGPVTHSGEILTTGKSHGKKLDRFSLNGDTDVKKVSQFKYTTWNVRGPGEKEEQLDRILNESNIKISVITAEDIWYKSH